MNTLALVLTIASMTISASVAGVAIAVGPAEVSVDGPHDASEHHAPGADEHAIEHGWAGDGHHNGEPGMHRPSFPEAVGKTPTDETARNLEQISRIQIRTDQEATPAAGIRDGNGTLDDPFVISGYYVTGDLYLGDTDACYVIKENYMGQQLSLNWNSQCVHVHHNFIRDLRVNENIRRDGYATGGLLELNVIEYIGQLRHYDGELRNNVVGPMDPDFDYAPVLETVPWTHSTDPRVANVDGFNQGLIHNNTFHGSVDLDLHGHHHGTGFFASHSHYHGDDEERKMAHDHTQRWTSVRFADNRIIDPTGYGLRYEDRNHAGDDQTARSEQEETLELPHVHYTHIELLRNVIDDGQLWVDVFNADDKLHQERNPGRLDIIGNQVTLHERVSEGPAGLPFFGPGTHWDAVLHVNTAKEVELTIAENVLAFKAAPENDDELDLWMFDDDQETQASGILLNDFRDAQVTIESNVFEDVHYAVRAHDFDEAVHWNLEDNDYGGAAYEVYYDESVANRPMEN